MKKNLLLIICLCFFALSSCDLYEDNYDTVGQITSVAIKSPDADFSQYKTFAITDSVLFIENEKSTRKKNELSDMVISCVAKEFESLGYMQMNSGDADLIVDLTYFEVFNASVYYDPYCYWDWAWWWDYYPYYPYDPFYPYYPYPMPAYYSAYSTGSLIIETVDMTRLENKNSVPIVWHALVRSILSGTHTAGEVQEAINDCFTMLPPVNNSKNQSKN